MSGGCSMHGREEKHKILVGKHGHSQDLCVDGRIILEGILGKQGRRMRIGFIWLRTGTSGGILRTRL
jgi:hypothetical protein